MFRAAAFRLGRAATRQIPSNSPLCSTIGNSPRVSATLEPKRHISVAASEAMPFANPLAFGLKPDDILAKVDKLIADAKAVEDQVGSTASPTFDAVFGELAKAENDMERDHSNCTFWQ